MVRQVEEFRRREHSNDPDLRCRVVTLDYGMRESRALLVWCEATRRTLGRLKPLHTNANMAEEATQARLETPKAKPARQANDRSPNHPKSVDFAHAS